MKKHLRPLGLIVLVLLVAFFNILFRGQTFRSAAQVPGVMPTGPYGYPGTNGVSNYTFGGDPGGSGWQIVAEETLIIKQLSKGEAPLWNPHQMFGTPLAHNLQLSPFFPLKAILLLNSSQLAWDIYKLLLFLIAGFFTYLYLTEIGFALAPSLIGSVGFMLCGFLVMYAHFSFMDVQVLIPALFFCIERWIRDPGRASFAGLALVFGLSFLCGYPVPVGMAISFAVLYFLYRFFEEKKRTLRSLWGFGCALAWGVAIAALILFPGIRLLLETQNVRPPGMGFAHNDFQYFYGAFFPYILTHLKSDRYELWCSWHGMAIGFFAAIAFLKPKQKSLLFFLGFAVFSFLKLAGLPPAHWIAYLPFFNRVINMRYLQPELSFCLAVLAAYGARQVFERKITFRALLSVVGGLLLIIALTLVSHRDAYMTWNIHEGLMRTIGLGIIWAALFVLFSFVALKKNVRYGVFLLVLLTCVELSTYAQRKRNPRYDYFTVAPYIEFLKRDPEKYRVMGLANVLFPPYGSGFEIDDVRWMNAINFFHYGNYIREFLYPAATDRLTGSETDLTAFGKNGYLSVGLDIANAKYILSDKDIYREPLSHLIAKDGKAVIGEKPEFTHNLMGGASRPYITLAHSAVRYPLRLRDDTVRLELMVENVGEKPSSLKVEIDDKILLGRSVAPKTFLKDIFLDVGAYRGKSVSLRFSARQPLRIHVEAVYGYHRAFHPLPLVYDKEVRIYENPRVLPRAYIAHDAVAFESDDQIAAEMKAPKFNPKRTVVLAAAKSIPDLPVSTKTITPARVTSYGDLKVEVESDSEAAGVLVLADTYYSLWRAYLDGKPATVHRANLAFRSVFVPAGKHRVVFRYEDKLFCYTLWISLLSAGATLALFFIPRDKKRKKAKLAAAKASPR